jgi:hypothetical protein
MSLLNPFAAGPSAELQHYRAVRERMVTLLSACLATLIPDELTATAKRLGMWSNGALIVDDEMARIFVFDAAIFQYRRSGETAVGRALRNLPPEAPALDRAILAGGLRYRWSVYEVVRIHRHEGGDLRDTLDGTVLRVWDEGLARDSKTGNRVAVRLVPVDDLWVTSGPAIAGIQGPITDMAHDCLPPAWHDSAAWPVVGTPDRDRLDLMLMAACQPWSDGSSLPATEPPRKGPCPCGSGKKFKHCCGKER